MIPESKSQIPSDWDISPTKGMSGTRGLFLPLNLLEVLLSECYCLLLEGQQIVISEATLPYRFPPHCDQLQEA